VVDEFRAVVVDTPTLARCQQTYGYDPRIHDWAKSAREALDGDVLRPFLTPIAEARL